MKHPKIVSPVEWLAARRELLRREKELTRARDAVNTARRELPMTRIEKDYRFIGPDGELGLADMFDGHRQLVIQHFMFDPAWETGCGSCTAMADGVGQGVFEQLAKRSTAFAAVSRAPYPKLRTYQESKGWTFAWYSAHGSDFNYDFHVTLDPAVRPASYNFKAGDELVAAGFDWMLDYAGEQPGISTFLRDGNDIFHTYSTYGRGLEAMMAAYSLLDLTALGRQEDWEEPKGRAPVSYPANPSFPA
ncbi:DUF899 domain-containing protein [Phytoactinopolyspora limicola]|uniref:DUF899 domain-containing protein n=1 Tax=Phytoactinopolyspora limicola TaxID=2715536 RepID=UPI00140C599E|nr:DUF899 domain-containing protein [Phytoactinopolyspora limicola]